MKKRVAHRSRNYENPLEERDLDRFRMIFNEGEFDEETAKELNISDDFIKKLIHDEEYEK